VVHPPHDPHFRGTLSQRTARALVHLKTQAGNNARLQMVSERLFRQALSSSDATAWVCATESVGKSALAFLEQRNVAVPSRLSVLCFDSTALARARNMTALNYNYTALIQAALTHILTPSRMHAYHRSGGSYVVEPFIDERNSSGPAGTSLPV
jgi:DNA-binding LacI/PurR family transcriptional regulator